MSYYVLPSMPFQFWKRGDFITQIQMNLPHYNSYNYPFYQDQLNQKEYSQQIVQKLNLVFRSDDNQNMISWVKALFSHFQFKEIHLLLNNINPALNILSELQPNAEELSFATNFPYSISALETFLKAQTHFSKLKKFSASFEIFQSEQIQIHAHLAQIIFNNRNTLENIHLSLDIMTLGLLLKEMAQHFQSIQDQPFPLLYDFTLTILPLDMAIYQELLEKGQQVEENYAHLPAFLNVINNIRTFRLYSSQTLTGVQMYSDICQFLLRQTNLKQLVLSFSRSRVAFDLQLLFRTLSSIKTLSSVDINLDYSTQVFFSKVDEQLDLSQITDLTLSLQYCPIPDQVLQAIKMTNLKQFDINISQIKCREQYAPSLQLLGSIIQSNTQLEIIKINFSSDIEKELEIQSLLLQKICENSANTYKNILIYGLSQDVFNQNLLSSFFKFPEFYLNFQKIKSISKKGSILQIQCYTQRAEVTINADFFENILKASKGFVHTLDFEGELYILEDAVLNYHQQFVQMFEYIQRYQHLLKISLSEKVQYREISEELSSNLMETLERCPNLLKLSLNSNYKKLINKHKDIRQICNILAKRFCIQQIDINYETSSISNIVSNRRKFFKSIINSLKHLKNNNIQNFFRKEIIQEIIQLTIESQI